MNEINKFRDDLVRILTAYKFDVFIENVWIDDEHIEASCNIKRRRR